MRIRFLTTFCFLALIIGFGALSAQAGKPPQAQAAGQSGDFVLTFAKVFLAPEKDVVVEEKANLVRETLVFHGDSNAPDKVTGKCVLEYAWSAPPSRFSSKALDKIAATSAITAKETSGEWTAQPQKIDMNMYFFKAADKETLDAVMAGKFDEVSPYKMLQLKIMSLMPDQTQRIDEMVSEKNQAQWLPLRRSWKGQLMSFTARDYPHAVLVIFLKGLNVDGYACYVYEYDPQGTKTPIRK
jgi:hypothetical protein